MAKRVYVKVLAEIDPDGVITPKALTFEDMLYEIDRVQMPPVPSAAFNAGGRGMRYRIRIRGKESYLFQEQESRRWFVEAKEYPGEKLDQTVDTAFAHLIPYGLIDEQRQRGGL